jgi:F-type H+-transporting ATPase subunit b
MNINLTLIAQALMFAALIWIIASKVWPPLLAAIEERQKKIADGLAAAEQGKQALAQAQGKEADLIREARGKANEILERAHQQANKIVDEAKVEAVAEKSRQLAATEAEVAALTQHAKSELRGQVASLAVKGAERLLKKEINPATHKQLLDELIAEI